MRLRCPSCRAPIVGTRPIVALRAPGSAQRGAHVGDGAHGPHAARHRRARAWRRPARRRGRAARGCARRSPRAGGRRSPRRRGRSAPSARAAPSPAQFSTARADERHEHRRASTPAVAARRSAAALERDEEVRGHRGGGVVGGAVVVGDRERAACPGRRPRRRAKSSARGVVPAMAQPAPAKAPPARVTVMSGCRPKASCGREDVEARGARAVADERAGRDRGRGGRDLGVGHAEQDDVGARAGVAAAVRAGGPQPAEAQGRGPGGRRPHDGDRCSCI